MSKWNGEERIALRVDGTIQRPRDSACSGVIRVVSIQTLSQDFQFASSLPAKVVGLRVKNAGKLIEKETQLLFAERN